MTTEEIMNHPKYNEAISVVESLSKYGTDKDKYEFGLPVYGKHMVIMAGIVIDKFFN